MYNYSMLAPYSIVFTIQSSLQKRAIQTKKSVCNCDNDRTLVCGNTLALVGNYTINSGRAH